jgi:endoglucanase
MTDKAISRLSVAAAILAGILLGGPVSAGEPLCYRGVNLSGGEYGSKGGVYAKDYIYPSQETVRYFSGQGMNTIRLPVLWERLQPALNGRLSAEEMGRLHETVGIMRKAGLSVILDLHNYAYYEKKRIGTDELPPHALADFWARFAAGFADDPGVAFGLMNEPHDIPTPDWLTAVNLSLAAIRTVDARNLVLIPGTIWTGAHSWQKDIPGGSNATVMLGVKDPLDHYAFELHQYMDSDFSGTHHGCERAAEAEEALAGVSEWLRQHGKRGFLGEFGGSRDKACLAGLKAMTARIGRDSDVWIGWTYWAAGEWWPEDEALNIQPRSSAVPPQLQALKPALEGKAEAGRCEVR